MAVQRDEASHREPRRLFESGFAGHKFDRAMLECNDKARRRLEGPVPESGQGYVRIIHGSNEDVLPVGGQTVGRVRSELGGLFNIAPGAEALVGGVPIAEDYTLRHVETLEFVSPLGRKGVGRVWTQEEFCALFKMSGADFDAMVARGLPVHRLEDGTVRIIETQADEFLDRQAGEGGRSRTSHRWPVTLEVRVVVAEAVPIAADRPTAGAEAATSHTGVSPYWDVDQAAAYLKKSPKAIYGLIERGKLRKMPGSHVCYFTKDMLDDFLRGGAADGRGLRPGRRAKG